MLKKFIFAICLGMSSQVFSANAVDFMKQSGLKIIREFPAPSGLIGLVIEQNGEYSVMFTTQDRQTIIAGVLMDARGNNLTAEYSLNQVPKQTKENNTLNQLNTTQYVKTGSGKPKVSLFAVFKPTCEICHLFYKLSTHYEGLEIKWIPIVTNEEDAQVVDTVFTAKDKSKALKDWFEKGIKNANASVENGNKIYQKNIEPLKNFNILNTPTLIYNTKDGTVYTKSGLPSAKEVDAITGIKHKTIFDSQLKQLVE